MNQECNSRVKILVRVRGADSLLTNDQLKSPTKEQRLYLNRYLYTYTPSGPPRSPHVSIAILGTRPFAKPSSRRVPLLNLSISLESSSRFWTLLASLIAAFYRPRQIAR